MHCKPSVTLQIRPILSSKILLILSCPAGHFGSLPGPSSRGGNPGFVYSVVSIHPWYGRLRFDSGTNSLNRFGAGPNFTIRYGIGFIIFINAVSICCSNCIFCPFAVFNFISQTHAVVPMIAVMVVGAVAFFKIPLFKLFHFVDADSFKIYGLHLTLRSRFFHTEQDKTSLYRLSESQPGSPLISTSGCSQWTCRPPEACGIQKGFPAWTHLPQYFLSAIASLLFYYLIVVQPQPWQEISRCFDAIIMQALVSTYQIIKTCDIFAKFVFLVFAFFVRHRITPHPAFQARRKI